MPLARPRRPARLKKPQRTGPRRDVVRIIIKTRGTYEQSLVQLSCGHRVRSNSPIGHRAHCDTCQEA
jgi:hypothetical protein